MNLFSETKACKFCNSELKKFGYDSWYCPQPGRHYTIEITNQINENNFEYEESVNFGDFGLLIHYPQDIWELEVIIKKWVGLDGGNISLTKKVEIEPFPLYSLEQIREKLETYITFI